MIRENRKTPCGECPFLRSSDPGWLGRSTPEDPEGFLEQTASGEIVLPCEETVYSLDEEEIDQRLASLCRGHLVFLRNTAKLPRDPEWSRACKEVPADRELVFDSIVEFEMHHARAAAVGLRCRYLRRFGLEVPLPPEDSREAHLRWLKHTASDLRYYARAEVQRLEEKAVQLRDDFEAEAPVAMARFQGMRS